MGHSDGIDLVWLAVDEAGQLAAMVTGGAGPIPARVLANPDDEVFAVELGLLALPVIGAASVHVQVPNPQSFKALSERGLFVYDWTDTHRSLANSVSAYELVASPSAGLSHGDLPTDIRHLAAPLDGGIRLGALTVKIG